MGSPSLFISPFLSFFFKFKLYTKKEYILMQGNGNIYMSAKRIMSQIVLLILLALMVTPRFNRQDLFIEKFTSSGECSLNKENDSYQYVLYTIYFRTGIIYEDLATPFTFRPLVPFIASFLPFKPMTAINIINILSLIAILFIIELLGKKMHCGFRAIILGKVLFIFSFPVFYYGSIGYLDPALVLCLFVSVYLIMQKKFFFFLWIIPFSVFVKESVILVIPVIIFEMVSQKYKRRFIVIYGLFLLLLTGLSLFIARKVSPIPDPYLWIPSLQVFIANLKRLNTPISFTLSFGIPGILTLINLLPQFRKVTETRFQFFYAGLIMTWAYAFYGVLTAYSDGRFIWTSYAFTIPLSSLWIDRQLIKWKSN